MKSPNTYNNDNRYVFSNWTPEDFIGQWAGVPTLVAAGESKELPEYLAHHFTKHLVDREMSRDGKSALMAVEEERAPYEAKTVAPLAAGADSPALAAIKEQIRAEVEAEAASPAAAPAKKGKGKKAVVEAPLSESAEFAGLEG